MAEIRRAKVPPFPNSTVAGNLVMSTWGNGRPARFTQVLVAALRKGSLDPDACAWLADFFESGGAGGLKFTVTRSRAGNPHARRKYPWSTDDVHSSDTWSLRMLKEEGLTKEEAFERAKAEFRIGKKRAEKYWKRINEDIAAEKEDPRRGKVYQSYKEAALRDNERGFCDWPQQDHNPLQTK